MSRYIDAEILLDAMRHITIGETDVARSEMKIVHYICHMPHIADVRENVRVEWQPIEVQPYFKKHFDTSVACSVCHRKGNKRWNFCPNCGADMRGDNP